MQPINSPQKQLVTHKWCGYILNGIAKQPQEENKNSGKLGKQRFNWLSSIGFVGALQAERGTLSGVATIIETGRMRPFSRNDGSLEKETETSCSLCITIHDVQHA